eukprot:jgi/Chlat1/7204/Chrsp57S06850
MAAAAAVGGYVAGWRRSKGGSLKGEGIGEAGRRRDVGCSCSSPSSSSSSTFGTRLPSPQEGHRRRRHRRRRRQQCGDGVPAADVDAFDASLPAAGVSHLPVHALDAAQPFDYESKKKRELQKAHRLKIGIVGFGNFGQFLAQRFVQQGHVVFATSRRDYSEQASKIGVRFFTDPDDFCEEHPEVVLLSTSILSTEATLKSLPLQRLRRNTLFVDVLSVKEFPKRLFLQHLPAQFDILCTHPMFGPQSGKGSWEGLPLVYEKVRVGSGYRTDRCDRFLKAFSAEGCRMEEMTCEEHDKYAASSQFITHTVGRVLGKLELQSTPINTKGYEMLLNLVNNTVADSFDLYYGLFMYNQNATDELDRLELAFDAVKKQLFTELHNVLRKQLFDGSAGGESASTNATNTVTPPIKLNGSDVDAHQQQVAARGGQEGINT